MTHGNSEIQQLMETAMTSLREMVDVNTVVGDLIETAGNAAVIPISRVSCGFVAGGGSYGKERAESGTLPFAGGSGAGMSVRPVGFLVGTGNAVRFVSAGEPSPLERAIEALPGLIEQVKAFFEERAKNKA
ncbi:MAG: GerW family sporulation protein [Clostridiales bacterium]|nr:GerW family sporulation protein [Clostridiales bacterium]